MKNGLFWWSALITLDNNNAVLTDFLAFFALGILSHTSANLTSCISIVFSVFTYMTTMLLLGHFKVIIPCKLKYIRSSTGLGCEYFLFFSFCFLLGWGLLRALHPSPDVSKSIGPHPPSVLLCNDLVKIYLSYHLRTFNLKLTIVFSLFLTLFTSVFRVYEQLMMIKCFAIYLFIALPNYRPFIHFRYV